MIDESKVLRRGHIIRFGMEPLNEMDIARIELRDDDDRRLKVSVYKGRDQAVVDIYDLNIGRSFIRGIIEGPREFRVNVASGNGIVLNFKGEDGKKYTLSCHDYANCGSFVLIEVS